MPFIGFLGPTWEPAAPTRILRRRMYINTDYLNIQVFFQIFEYCLQFYSTVQEIFFHDIAVGNRDGDFFDFIFCEEPQFLGFGADPLGGHFL